MCAGVIAGVVSFILAHSVKWALDKLSDRTGGFFGYCTPPPILKEGDDSEKGDYSVSDKEGDPSKASVDDSVASHEVC
jgi:hypothetical protein